MGVNTWSARVYNDKVFLTEGKLYFGHDGQLTKQEGLTHVQWATEYGSHELKIDAKNSTQYGMPFSVMMFRADGYGLGRLVGLDISSHGEYQLMYDNGQMKSLKGRIAIARFTNPSFLESTAEHIYKPTMKSGYPMVHWLNSEGIINGALEESC